MPKIPDDYELAYGERAYIAQAKRGRSDVYQSPRYTTREEAVADAFAACPKAKSVASGYGYNGGFDIRYHRRGWK